MNNNITTIYTSICGIISSSITGTASNNGIVSNSITNIVNQDDCFSLATLATIGTFSATKPEASGASVDVVALLDRVPKCSDTDVWAVGKVADRVSCVMATVDTNKNNQNAFPTIPVAIFITFYTCQMLMLNNQIPLKMYQSAKCSFQR
ncbi:hypothetical protein SUGI_0014150 [Cryptomeria japonica]|nr:hypothetical protein SUGI_0014150 [Cryptomeria japonica]